jgi:hypothetical protein
VVDQVRGIGRAFDQHDARPAFADQPPHLERGGRRVVAHRDDQHDRVILPSGSE